MGPSPPPSSSDAADPLDELLFECLRLPEAEQPGAMERLCREHPGQADRLRRRYRILADIGFVESEAPGAAGEELPRDFGKYRLVRRIGSGGMGIVYLAEDAPLDRRVALKLIRPEHLHFPRARERFRREVLAASRLEHPGICTVYEAGEVEETPYIAMRYLEGESLAERIARARRAPQPDPSALSAGLVSPPAGREDSGSSAASGGASRAGPLALVWLFERLARALHAAHEAGLVHRDVKPGNVMVTHEGEPVLLDFGLAHGEAVEEQQLTLSGDLLGTPAYMAPEQVRGKGAPVDRRTDVYGLGATLYECLTLRCPFAGENREELFRQILGSDPANPRRANPRVSHDLRAVLERALEKDPARRYATALELAEELRRIRCFEPVQARTASPLLRARRWIRRHPAHSSVMAVLVLATLVSLLFLRQKVEALDHSRALLLAEAAAEALEDDPALALHLALEAVEIEEIPETISEVHRALAHLHPSRELPHGGSVRDLDLSRDGTRLLTASAIDGLARIWDLDSDSDPVVLGEAEPSHAHTLGLLWARFSPDEELVVTASVDGHAKLWSSSDSWIKDLRHPQKPGEDARWAVQSAVFHPTLPLILTGCLDGIARLWSTDPQHEDPILEIPAHTSSEEPGARPIRALFSPDGERILTHMGTETFHREIFDYRARLWTLEGDPVGEDMEHEDQISWATFSSDGERILTTTMGREARLWDRDGTLIQILGGHCPIIWSGAFSPDDKLAVTASNDGLARLWDVRSGTLLRELRGHSGSVFAAAILQESEPDSVPLILTGALDQKGRVWTLSGREVAVLRGHLEARFLPRVAFVPNRFPPRMITASGDHTAWVWELWHSDLPILIGHQEALTSADQSPDGKLIATASRDGIVRLWNREGEALRRIRAHDGVVIDVKFSPDGTMLATVGLLHGEVKIWDVQKLDRKALLRIPIRGFAFSVSFCPTEDRILIATGHGPRQFDFEGNEIEVIREEGSLWEGEEREHVPDHAAFSPHGDSILARFSSGHLRLYDCEGRYLRTFEDHGNRARAACFHPLVKSRLVSADRDGKMILWDLDDEPAKVKEFFVPGLGIETVAFSANGQRIVTAHSDGAARVWSLGRNDPVAVLRGHTGALEGAFFSPDGERILTLSEDCTARFWFARTEDLLEHARSRDKRSLTSLEYARYAHLLDP